MKRVVDWGTFHELESDPDFLCGLLSKYGFEQEIKSFRYGLSLLPPNKSTMEVVYKNRWAFQHLSESVRDNKTFVTEALQDYGFHIEFASNRLASSVDMEKIAIQTSPTLILKEDLMCCPCRVKYELLFSALTTDPLGMSELYCQEIKDAYDICELERLVYECKSYNLVDFLPPLRNSFDVANEIAANDPMRLKLMSFRFRSNLGLGVQSMQANAASFQYLAPSLQRNPRILAMAIAGYEGTLKYMDYRLRANEEFVTECVKRFGSSLKYASMELRSKPSLVLRAMQDPHHPYEDIDWDLFRLQKYAIEDLSNVSGVEHHDDFFKVLTDTYLSQTCAIRTNPMHAFSKFMLQDFNVLKMAVRHNGKCIMEVDRAYRKNIELLTIAYSHQDANKLPSLAWTMKHKIADIQDTALVYALARALPNATCTPKSMAWNQMQDVASELIAQVPARLVHASAELKNNVDVVKEAVSREGNLMSLAGPIPRADKQLALMSVCTPDSFALKWLNPLLQDDLEVCKASVACNPRTFAWVSEKMRRHPEVIKAAAKTMHVEDPEEETIEYTLKRVHGE